MTNSRSPKIWRRVLVHLVERNGGGAKKNPPTFTAGEVSEELGMSYPSAAQLLKRLQTWGHVRHTGFEAPEGETGRGRRRKVYEVTEHGLKCSVHYRPNDKSLRRR